MNVEASLREVVDADRRLRLRELLLRVACAVVVAAAWGGGVGLGLGLLWGSWELRRWWRRRTCAERVAHLAGDDHLVSTAWSLERGQTRAAEGFAALLTHRAVDRLQGLELVRAYRWPWSHLGLMGVALALSGGLQEPLAAPEVRPWRANPAAGRAASASPSESPWAKISRLAQAAMASASPPADVDRSTPVALAVGGEPGRAGPAPGGQRAGALGSGLLASAGVGGQGPSKSASANPSAGLGAPLGLEAVGEEPSRGEGLGHGPGVPLGPASAGEGAPDSQRGEEGEVAGGASRAVDPTRVEDANEGGKGGEGDQGEGGAVELQTVGVKETEESDVNAGRPGRLGSNDAPGTEDGEIVPVDPALALAEEWIHTQLQASAAGVVREVEEGRTGQRSAVGYQRLVMSYRAVAEAAVRGDEVAPTRRDYVRRYFDALAGD